MGVLLLLFALSRPKPKGKAPATWPREEIPTGDPDDNLGVKPLPPTLGPKGK